MAIVNKDILTDKEVFTCECHMLEHSLSMIYIKSDIEKTNEENVIYAEAFLITYRGFWKRLWFSIKYIFGNNNENIYDGITIRVEECQRLKEFMSHIIINNEGGYPIETYIYDDLSIFVLKFNHIIEVINNKNEWAELNADIHFKPSKNPLYNLINMIYYVIDYRRKWRYTANFTINENQAKNIKALAQKHFGCLEDNIKFD